jgi:asparagine synthase (glutamine-hydrolysing)
MCGLAGIVAFEDRFPIDREMLMRMAKALAHRGPDGQEVWLSESAEPKSPRCGLAFARLSILDLDPRAMQPMTDGKRWLVFNGEIYNFREIRQQLAKLQPDYAWKTTGDSEVILRSYQAWGSACVEHFNGMFALAIWDPQTRELFLARDRMGQKPLYYAIAPGGGAIAFASELGALRPLDWPDRSVDPSALMQYLQCGYIAAPQTIYRDISKLPPACRMMICANEPAKYERYFHPNKASGKQNLDFRHLVLEAVSRQMVADVPIGCFLSGGIDSSIVAYGMKNAVARGQRVLTFSIGFDDPRYDETAYARQVADYLQTEHRQFTVRPDAAADLPKLAQVYGEPFGDSSGLPTHYLSRETRGFVKVALAGDGGDELFGGYDRYRAMALSKRLQNIPGFIWNLMAALPGSHPKSRIARLKRFAQAAHLPPAARYAAYMAMFSDDQAAALLHRDTTSNPVQETFESLLANDDLVRASAATDRLTYLPEDLLTKVDRASMLHGLEVRAPFMDHDLVSAAAGLSGKQLIGDGPKAILRNEFAANLPEFVFRRKKMGFAVPVGDWLRNELLPMFNDLVYAENSFSSSNLDIPNIQSLQEAHLAGQADHSQRLYALLMLELWWTNCNRAS